MSRIKVHTMAMMSVSQALHRWIQRQERTVVSAIGAMRPLGEAFQKARWCRELAGDLVSIGVPEDRSKSFAELLTAGAEAQLRDVYGYGVRAERIQTARAIYADLYSRIGQMVALIDSHGVADTAGDQLLYKLYDTAGVLLYVGVTDRGPARLVEHYRTKTWFPLVARVEFERYNSREAVLRREAEAIRSLMPVYNIQHNGKGRPECLGSYWRGAQEPNQRDGKQTLTAS